MSRYIDADALFEKKYAKLKEGEVLYRISPQDIIDAPTADVVEIVRCRDCKHLGVCGTHLFYLKDPNSFCSHGERRGECSSN